jgi:hypothetical protein
MAVAKPKNSKLFLPLRTERDTLVLMQTQERCLQAGIAVLPDNIGSGNKFQNPADWEVKAASVTIEE